MLYRIGDFSRISRVTVRALRYYDEIGLLKPVQVDRTTGYRYYSIEQLPVLQRIIMLKEMGLSLEDIIGLSGDDTRTEDIRRLLQVKQSEITSRLSLETSRLHQVEAWIQSLDAERAASSDIHIQRKTVPEIRVVSKREIGTYEETTRKLYDDLIRAITSGENKDRVTITGPVTGLFHDDEYKETDADIEIAIPVSGEIGRVENGIDVKLLPEINAITTMYKGNSVDIHRYYAMVMAYAETHGLQLLGPVRELYFTYPEENPDMGLFLEIQAPFVQAVR